MAEEGRSGGEGGNGGIGGDGASNAGGRGGTGKGSGEAGRFKSFVASELGVEPERVLGWDLCLYDVQAPCVSGAAGDFVHAARLDNLGSCHAGLAALLGGAGSGGEAGTAGADASSVVALFDHEEVGSRSTRGAESSFLRDVLQRLAGREPEALLRASARSFIVSADMAHGVHPNYADRHEPEHRPVLNGGPVLKTHVEWRYATDAETMAVFRGLCADLSVPLQDFVIRSDLACGTTIGPIVAANLGIRTVDVGNPMLSMHSCREMAGAQDAERMIRVMEAFLGWSGE
jgi:aspartyl aminopeptidase